TDSILVRSVSFGDSLRFLRLFCTLGIAFDWRLGLPAAHPLQQLDQRIPGLNSSFTESHPPRLSLGYSNHSHPGGVSYRKKREIPVGCTCTADSLLGLTQDCASGSRTVSEKR